MISLVGEDAELGNILAQPMGESVEHDGQDDDGKNGKPDVMLVSLQRFREIIIIRQGTSDDDRVGREIGSHIEVILLQGLRLSFHARSQSILQRLLYLLAVQVIGKPVIVLAHIVIHHLTVGPYQRDTQILTFMFTDESIQFGFRHDEFRATHAGQSLQTIAVAQDDSSIMSQREILLQEGVVVFQFHRERTDLILFLTSLLEHDKTDSEHKEHRQYHEIQFSPNFGFRFLYFQHR